MTAYVIADLDISDPDLYREYAALVPATLEPDGGRFIVAGGNCQPLEGRQPRYGCPGAPICHSAGESHAPVMAASGSWPRSRA